MTKLQTMRTADAIETELKAKFGLSWTRFKTLLAARDVERPTIGNVCNCTDIALSTMTAQLDLLERDGWLVRERSKADRRAIFLRVLRLEELAQAEAFLQSSAVGSLALTA